MACALKSPTLSRLAEMTSYETITESPDETRQIGARLAAVLRPGDLVGLQGDLGAGKTVFTQGITEGIGAEQQATSPSFVLIHIYTGRIRLVHVDLYRLSSIQAEELGLDDYLAEAAGVVEWAERLVGLEPDLWVKISPLPEAPEQRRLEFLPQSTRGQELAQSIRD